MVSKTKQLSPMQKDKLKQKGNPLAVVFWLTSLPLIILRFPFLFSGKKVREIDGF